MRKDRLMVQEEAWQEYELADGFVARTKPAVVKTVKHGECFVF